MIVVNFEKYIECSSYCCPVYSIKHTCTTGKTHGPPKIEVLWCMLFDATTSLITDVGEVTMVKMSLASNAR